MKTKMKNPILHFEEKYPNVKENHPDIYIKYLEDVIDTYYKTYTLRDQEETE